MTDRALAKIRPLPPRRDGSEQAVASDLPSTLDLISQVRRQPADAAQLRLPHPRSHAWRGPAPAGPSGGCGSSAGSRR